MFRVESIRTPWIIVNHVTPPKFEGWTSKNNRKTSSNNQQGHTHMKRRLTIEVLSTWICFLLQDILCQWHVPILRRDVQGAVPFCASTAARASFMVAPLCQSLIISSISLTGLPQRKAECTYGRWGQADAMLQRLLQTSFSLHTHTVTHMIYM